MNLFTVIGNLFNASATVGMWIFIGVVVLLAVVIVCLILLAVRRKSDELDFSDSNSIDVEVSVSNNQDQTNTVEEFVTLKTDEQFEAAKVEKVVATANEDIEYENTVKAQAEVNKPEKKQPKTSAKKIQEKSADEKAEVSVKKEKPTEKKEKKVNEKEKTAVNAEKKESALEQKEDSKRTVNGKWVIEHKSQDEYISKLLASNGEVMLTSEIYTTVDGAKSGISTIIKGVDGGKFVIYQDKNGNYYYKLKTSANRLLCVGEIYKSKEKCLKSVESVKRFAANSPIAEEVFEGAQYIAYTPAPLSNEYKKGTRGKWKIEKNEEGEYCAKLYASNGQLMLATEQVSQKSSAMNAVSSVKKNAEQGNFIIDRDKFGRYYYKLRNSLKSVICIGETYDTLESCTSAIESVRRFALSATVPGENEQQI